MACSGTALLLLLRGAYCLHHQGDGGITLMMEALIKVTASSYETSVIFYQTTRRYNILTAVRTSNHAITYVREPS
jgi:hypothetical protein